MSTLMLPSPTLAEGRLASIPVFTDEALFAACGVRIAFTTRAGGVSEGAYASLNLGSHVEDDPVAVEENRALLMRALLAGDAHPSSGALVVPRQVHGDTVLTIEEPDQVAQVRIEADEGADAIIVAAREVAALLCFADCVPVIIVLPTARFAVIHAGWRGVENTIVAKTLSLMFEQEASVSGYACESLLSGANVYIGPYIHRECFETSEEIHDLFVAKFGTSCSFDARHIDLGAALRVQLQQIGVDPLRICDIDRCTVCENERFFSFRAQSGIAGRHGAVAIRL